MPLTPAQTKTAMNADLTALNGQLTALQTVRKAVPAGVNPRDIQLLDKQITQTKALIETVKHRISRAP
jgi:hypothetical protein